MTIKEVYQKLDTPQNLIDHMLAVARLVECLQKTWSTDIAINWHRLILAALLHDIGNVVKFDLEKHPQLLGPELPRLEYWRTKQQELIARYGSDDHATTEKMLVELGLDNTTRDLIGSKSFGNIVGLNNSSDHEAKALLYCDLRVMPDKVASLDERIDDVKARLTKYSQRSNFSDLIKAAKDIEAWVMGNTTGFEASLGSVKLGDIESDRLLLTSL